MRFSIRELLGAVAVGGLSLACLMYASTPWAQAAFSLTLGVLTLAIVGAVLRQGERRAYWTGFAVCGWIYMALSSGPWFSTSIRYSLVTTRLLAWAYPLLVPEGRRPEGYRSSIRALYLPRPTLGEGITMGTLSSSTPRVDVWAKRGTGSKSLLAENVQVIGLSDSGNVVVSVAVETTAEEHARLTQALADGAAFILERPRATPFSGLWSSPPVQSDEFQNVGHALVGLLYAWLGSIAGRFFFTPRQPTGTSSAG